MPRKKLPENEKKVSINTTVSRQNYDNSQVFRSQAEYYEFLLKHLDEAGQKELDERWEKFILS